MAMFFEIITME